LTIWHCILSAEVTKNALLQTVFWRLGDLVVLFYFPIPEEGEFTVHRCYQPTPHHLTEMWSRIHRRVHHSQRIGFIGFIGVTIRAVESLHGCLTVLDVTENIVKQPAIHAGWC